MQPTVMGIRIHRRDGRNVFVFHNRGSDLFELEEIPPFEVRAEETGDGMVAGRPEDEAWSRTSLSTLRRALETPKSKG